MSLTELEDAGDDDLFDLLNEAAEDAQNADPAQQPSAAPSRDQDKKQDKPSIDTDFSDFDDSPMDVVPPQSGDLPTQNSDFDEFDIDTLFD